MSTTQEIRKSFTESIPFQALVGVTDLAVERVRGAVADVEKVVGSIEPKDLQAAAKELPALAVSTATATAAQLADRAEATYVDLAGRGKDLIDRVRSQKATQDLIAQSRSTVSLTRSAVTTARKAATETASAAIGLVTQARDEAETVTATSAASAKEATAKTKAAARKTTGTAKKTATATRSRAKAATTSARKSAAAARKAAATTAAKVGD